MTNVADTSAKHYKDMRENGEIGDQAHKVKQALEKLDGNPTINELGHTIELSGMDNSTISGRLNDLKDIGIVQDLEGDAKREDKFSGITCKVWSLVNQEEDEFVTMEEADSSEEESTEELFKNDEQPNEPQPGDVIYG